MRGQRLSAFSDSGFKTPVFFKLWFAFCATMAVGILCLMVWAFIKIVPAVVKVLEHFSK